MRIKTKKILDVWPQRPNQKIIDLTQVFTERASRRSGGDVFIRDDYTGMLIKYTTSPAPGYEEPYPSSSAVKRKRRTKSKFRKIIPERPLKVSKWPLAEHREFYLLRVDTAVRSLLQFDERHAENLWKVLNMVHLDDLMRMNVIQNIAEFYETEIVPAIQNLKEYMDTRDDEETQKFYDANRGEYEDFIDDDNEGTVTIPLTPRPEIFPFQISLRNKLTFEKATPSPENDLENFFEEYNKQFAEHQRQLLLQQQQAFQTILNSTSLFGTTSYPAAFCPYPYMSYFAPTSSSYMGNFMNSVINKE